MFKIIANISESYLYSESLLQNLTDVCEKVGVELVKNVSQDNLKTIVQIFKGEMFIKEICGTTYSQLIGEIALTIRLN